MKTLTNKRRERRNTITVDWVVLTAAIVGLGAAVLASISTGLMTFVDGSNSQFQTFETQNSSTPISNP